MPALSNTLRYFETLKNVMFKPFVALLLINKPNPKKMDDVAGNLLLMLIFKPFVKVSVPQMCQHFEILE